MTTLKLKTIIGSLAVGLLLTAAVHAEMGQKSGAPGTDRMMQCGMAMSATVPLSSASTAKNALKITAKMVSPVSSCGNALDIGVTTADGNPMKAAKVTAQVAMTSMDMGTTDPVVKETGKGHYSTTVTFSMAGPWRVTVKVSAAGHKPQTKAFDFTAS